ncbi:ParB/RepB/Spo0J family partition protein [Rhodanobacter sp. PCA2]|uniref:ParB/RepB/Spo0J family partition protein n=1 Tax=Rhodanobacter sp. PCA2 TaxID=2006117 RepID=UPI0015E64316|nr:ParB/RepB/Spo0J family partition protein [Rhodanobacter sp. PCA2]
MTVDQTLQRLKAAEVRRVAITELRTDDALQPRDIRLVPYAERTRTEGRSEDHIGTMLLALRASAEVQLEPLLLAEIDGSLFVVDGHHRLKAYQRAQRETIPARVMPMKHHMAVMVSQLVNCEGRSLEMHQEQRRESAWQYLAHVTQRGARGLPAGESMRTIAARFGIPTHVTISNMLRRLPTVSPQDFTTEAHNPGTGFPQWRHVRGPRTAHWKEMAEKMTPEQLHTRDLEKLKVKIGALLGKADPKVAHEALADLWKEATDDVRLAEEQAFREETAEAFADF